MGGAIKMAAAKTNKKDAKGASKVQPKGLEEQYAEIVRTLQTEFGPLPDGASLAQPSPYRTVPTVVTYGAYDQPIMG